MSGGQTSGDGTDPPPAEWSAGAVARMLGVSPSTLRTWDRRYGLGPTVREAGRHRRYTDQDVARLYRMVELTAQGVTPAAAAANALGRPAPDQPRDGGGPRAVAVGRDAPRARGFSRAAARLDAPRMRTLATGLVAEHGVQRAWHEVFAPVLIELGRQVAAGRAGVEVEHLVSDCVRVGLRSVPDPPEQGRLPALLACAPDEQHQLPLDALAAALAEVGCPSRNLGARVPAGALLTALDRLTPATVVVWAHAPEYARQVPVADILARDRIVLIPAGPGWAGMEPAARPESLAAAVDAVLAVARPTAPTPN